MKSIYILSLAMLGFMACKNTSKNNEKTNAPKDSLKTQATTVIKEDVVTDGESITFYKSGKVKFQGMMKNGKREGLWKSYYESGVKWSETTFSEGKKNGKTTTWFENSQMRYDGFYTNDVESGQWSYWDEQGKLSQKKDFGSK